MTINPSWSLRTTWQATPRNKIGFSVEPQNRHWINALNTTFSPEIYPDWQFNHESLWTGSWTSPVTNKLLLEGRFANHAEGFVDKYPEPDDPYRKAIPVREASTGFLYRGKGYCCLPVFFGTQNAPFTMQYSGAVSYITGSHAMKVGIQNDFGTLEQQQLDNECRVVLHVQQRRADVHPAARAALHPDDPSVAGHGHLRAGQVDVRAGHDQRGYSAGPLQEQLPRAASRAHPVHADPQRHGSRDRRTPT